MRTIFKIFTIKETHIENLSLTKLVDWGEEFKTKQDALDCLRTINREKNLIKREQLRSRFNLTTRPEECIIKEVFII